MDKINQREEKYVSKYMKRQMSNTTGNQGIAYWNHMAYQLQPFHWQKLNTKCWRRNGLALLYCFSMVLGPKIEHSCTPWATYSTLRCLHKRNPCTWNTWNISKTRKQPECPSVEQWITYLWESYTLYEFLGTNHSET